MATQVSGIGDSVQTLLSRESRGTNWGWIFTGGALILSAAVYLGGLQQRAIQTKIDLQERHVEALTKMREQHSRERMDWQRHHSNLKDSWNREVLEERLRSVPKP